MNHLAWMKCNFPETTQWPTDQATAVIDKAISQGKLVRFFIGLLFGATLMAILLGLGSLVGIGQTGGLWSDGLIVIFFCFILWFENPVATLYTRRNIRKLLINH